MSEVVRGLKVQEQMLGQILAACTYEPPTEDNPIVTLLEQLVGLAMGHAEVLAQVSATVERIELQNYRI
jgi:hypothetical protein